MTPFSAKQLDVELQRLQKRIAELLGLSGNAINAGIVSQAIEKLQPLQLAVSWDAEIQRLQVTRGSVLFEDGSAATLSGTVTDLPWPDASLLFVVLLIETKPVTVENKFKRTVELESYPGSYLQLMTKTEYDAADRSHCVLLAVLTNNGAQRDVDQTSLYYEQNRKNAVVRDVAHRASAGKYTSPANPHGIGIDEIDVNGVTLLSQLFQTGYMVPKETEYGIPGKRVSFKLDHEISIDPIGRFVEAGHYYAVLQAMPTSKPHVRNAVTGYEVAAWIEGTSLIDFGFTDPGAVIVELVQAIDLELVPKRLQSTALEFRGVLEGPVVSGGKVVAPDKSTCDLGKFDGLSLDIAIEVDSAGLLKTSPQVIEVATISDTKSMTADAVTLDSYSQLAIGVVDSQMRSPIPQPDGSISVASAEFIGTRRLIYSISCDGNVEFLNLTSPGWTGALVASVTSEWTGYVKRNSEVLASHYWRRSGSSIYVDSRAVRDGDVFVYVVDAFDSGRNLTGHVEVVGTAPTPNGVAATASISLLTNALDSSDVITVAFGSSTNYVKLAAGINFSVGLTIEATAMSISAALNNNALFKRRAVASYANERVSITAKRLGVEGNQYTLSATSETENKFDVDNFSGGSATYEESKYDVVGLGFKINQPMGTLPPGAKLRVYMTNNVKSDSDAKQYYLLAERSIENGPDHSFNVSTAMVDELATAAWYDVDKAFYAKISVSGVDVNGAQATETIELNDLSCYEPTFPRQQRSRFAFTKRAWKKIERWIALDTKNVGSTKLVFMAGARNKGSVRCKIASVDHAGSELAVFDARLLKPSTLNRNPVDQQATFIGALALRSFK